MFLRDPFFLKYCQIEEAMFQSFFGNSSVLNRILNVCNLFFFLFSFFNPTPQSREHSNSRQKAISSLLNITNCCYMMANYPVLLLLCTIQGLQMRSCVQSHPLRITLLFLFIHHMPSCCRYFNIFIEDTSDFCLKI